MPPARAALWSQVDHPICTTNDIRIVLDNDNGMSLVEEGIE
jgi:hypothetical protein